MNETLKVYEIASSINCNSSKIISVSKELNIEITNIRSEININDIEKIKTYIEKNTRDEEETFKSNIKILFSQMTSLKDFVALLNLVGNEIQKGKVDLIELKKLTFYAFHSKHKYKTFYIKKKTGGNREIHAPIKRLKKILKSLNYIFQCIYTPHEDAHGFSQKKSIISNARKHINKNYVFNIDLKNFFPNIKQARIWRRLQLEPFNLNGEDKIKIVNLIANLVCYQNEVNNNFLAQGFPTSPILSNAIAEKLDMKLRRLAKKYNVKYSRYADDITFSSNKNIFQNKKGKSNFINELKIIINEENFQINETKIRLQKKDIRQVVTGITVNKKLNVSRKYIKELRSIIYILEKFGIEKAGEIFIENKRWINQKRFEKASKNKSIFAIGYIKGRLEYLKNVKGEDDSTFKKLKERFNNCIHPLTNRPIHNPKKLIEILSCFSKGTKKLKYTTHIWDLELGNDSINSYSDFIERVRDEYSAISDNLSKLSTRLRSKIWNFLLNENIGEDKINDKKSGWGQFGIQFGWSSPELKEWCEKNKNPFLYVLDKKYTKEIKNKKIYNFMDVVDVFKNEIEIRSSIDRFNEIILEKRKFLGADFIVKKVNTDGIGFFTDVQWFELGLLIIFGEIKKRVEFPNITIDVKKNIDNYEIRIIQEKSLPYKSSKEMLDEISSGDFLEIYNSFYSLCDWSVEAVFTDGNYRVNYLISSENKDKIEELKIKPEGFTHLMRFYI